MRVARSCSRLTAPAAALAALLPLAACAARQEPDLGVRALQLASQQSTPYTTSRSSYVIDGATLPGDRLLSEVVSERWPLMVRGDLPRGEQDRFGALDRFAVYDARGMFLGGPGYLESVRARDVVRIRRLTFVEEAALFGHGHPAGAVLITWRTGAGSR